MQPRSYRDPYYTDLAFQTEQQLGLPRALLASIITHGERSNPDQVSEAGARTVTQVIPETRNALIKKYGVDPYAGDEQAVLGAGYLLKESLQRNNNNPLAAAAEYHGGTNRNNWGPRTRAYVDRVQQGMQEYNPIDRATPEEKAMMNDSNVNDQILHDAYKNNEFTPEERAAYEQYFNVKSQQTAQPAQNNDESILHNAYKNNEFTPEERAAYENYYGVGNAAWQNKMPEKSGISAPYRPDPNEPMLGRPAAASVGSPEENAAIARYQRVITGKASPEETAQFKQQLASGEIKLPANYGFGKPAEVPAYQTTMPDRFSMAGEKPEDKLWNKAGSLISQAGSAIKESITGAERTTPETQSAPDMFGGYTGSGGMPELANLNTGEMGGQGASLERAITSTNDPKELAQIMTANFPGVQPRQDNKGNWFFKSGIDGKEYVWKPGLSKSDIYRIPSQIIPQTVAALAGRNAYGLAGEALLTAAQTALDEANQKSQGGEFDTSNVIISGAAPVAFEGLGAAGKKIFGSKQAASAVDNVTPPPSGGIDPNAPPSAPIPSEPTPPPTGAVPAEIPTPKTITKKEVSVEAADKKIAEAIIKNIKKPSEKNASLLQKTLQDAEGNVVDEKILAAVKEFHPELEDQAQLYLPKLKNLFPSLASYDGSVAKEALDKTNELFRTGSKEFFTKRGGGDIAGLSEDVGNKVFKEIENKKNAASALRDQTVNTIADTQPVAASNLRALLQGLEEKNIIKEADTTIDGVKLDEKAYINKLLSEKRKELKKDNPLMPKEYIDQQLQDFSKTIQIPVKSTTTKKITPQLNELLNTLNKTDGKLTKASLRAYQQDIGEAINYKSGAFSDVDNGTLKQVYGAIKNDEDAYIKTLLPPEARAKALKANQLYHDAFNQQEQFIKNIGYVSKEGEFKGDIVKNLTGAVNDLEKGSSEQWKNIMEFIPIEKRAPALWSTIGKLSMDNEGKYSAVKAANLLGKIRQSETVMKNLISSVAKGSKDPGIAKQVYKDIDILHTVAETIADANKKKIYTGKLMDKWTEELNKRGMLQSFAESKKGKWFATLISGALAAKSGGLTASLVAGGAVHNAMTYLANLGGKVSVRDMGAFLSSPQMQKIVEASRLNNGKVPKSMIESAMSSSLAKRIQATLAKDKNFIKSMVGKKAAASGATPKTSKPSEPTIATPVKKESTGKVNLFKNGVKNDQNK